MSDTRLKQSAVTDPAEEFSRLFSVGDEEAALDVAVAALSSDNPFDPPFESVWWLCDELRARRQFRLALHVASRASERGYSGWRALYLRGTLEALNRRMSEAADTLERACSQAPRGKRSEIAMVLARVRTIGGAHEEAVRLFEKYSNIRTLPPHIADIAVRAALLAGNEEVALAWARRNATAHGATPHRAALLARLYMNTYDWTSARKAAEEGLRFDGTNIELQRLVAISIYGEKRIAQAIAHLEKLAGVDSDWTEGKVMLCSCLVSAGRVREARQIFHSIGEDAASSGELELLRERLGEKSGDAGGEEASGKIRRRRGSDPLRDPEVQHILANMPADFVPSWTEETIAKSGSVSRAFGKLVHSVRTIMLRETMARFGRHEIGYLWAILEPLIHVVILSIIFYFIRARDTLGMNVILFVATGIIPLFFYMKTYNGLVNILKQNRPLLNHPGVQPMDIFFARSILEFLTQLLVFIIFTTVIYLFIEEYRFGSAWSILTNIFGLWITGIGMGLIIGSVMVFAESIKNVMDGLNRLIYISSGVFFTLDMMPHAVAEYLSWNPLLHFVDGVRGNFNPLMGGTRVDIGYAYVWAVAILFCGLVADRALRHRVLDR